MANRKIVQGESDIDRVLAYVRGWRDELIDLTRRNKLINLTDRGVLVLTEPSAATVLDGLPRGWRFFYPQRTAAESGDAALVEALEAEDPDATALPAVDEVCVKDVTAARLSSALRNLERRATSDWNDKGVRVTYLAVGALRWQDGPGEERRSPLLMVPVQLERLTPRDPFRMTSSDEDWLTNPGLAVKLEQDFGILLPDFDDGLGLGNFLASVRLAIREHPKWDVEDLLALGTFSFAKEAMYRDLKDNEAQIAVHPLVQVLTGVSRDDLAFEPVTEQALDQIAPPELLPTILDADGTQRQCLEAARRGGSFVMDGPPGTGKSQTIANLIADLMREGKTVLFVSEKAAALDVVKRRLDTAGLGSYVLELHSHKATRKEVAADLGRALVERPRARQALDAVQIDQLRQRREQLSSYAIAMNERRAPLNRSLHDVLGRLGQLSRLEQVPIPDWVDGTISAHRLAELLEIASALGRSWGPVTRGDDFLWRDLVDAEAASSRTVTIAKAVDDALDAAVALDDVASMVAGGLELDNPRKDADVRRLLAIAQHLAQPADALPTWVATEAAERADQLRGELEEPTRQRLMSAGRLGPSAPNWEVLDPADAAQLEALRSQLDGFVDLPADLPIDGLRLFAEEIAQTERDLSHAHALAAALAFRLELDPPKSIEDIESLSSLAAFAGTQARPERAWFDPSQFAAVREAASMLRPLVEQWRGEGVQLATVFNDQVSVFDVEALYDGDNDLVPELSRLSSKGREHRGQLKAVSKNGKITDAVKAALPTLRSWKRVVSSIRARDNEFGVLLGSTYWQAESTDVEALAQALSVAAATLETLGTRAVPEGLKGRLALDGTDREATSLAAAALRDAHESRLKGLARPELAGMVDRLSSAAYDEGLSMCGRVRTALSDIDGIASRVAAQMAGTPTFQNVCEVLALRSEVARIDTQLTSAEPIARELLGHHWQRSDTDWIAVRTGIDWSRRLRQLLPQPPTVGHASRLLSADLDPESLSASLANYDKRVDAVLGEFRARRAADVRADLATSVEVRSQLLTEFRTTIADIDEWHRHEAASSALISADLGDVVEHARDRRLDHEDVPSSIEYGVLAGWARHVMKTDRRLNAASSKDRDALVEEFRSLDRESVRLAASTVIDACNRRRPTTVVGEVNIIQTEANKKTRHRPIRKLLEDAGSASQALKPCFMMSPLTVSQFLPSGLHFDTVIFDEASQVRPCEAANAIYRGGQLIVAGDDKQLPPTSFFAVGHDEDDEWDDESIEVFESVLGLCKGAAALPALPLRWHYRSQHESLITFSNRQFYDSRLVTYPGALDVAEDVGVEFIHVPDGVYGRGSSKDNVIEARIVVERIIFHAEAHPNLTLGVVAFSEPHATRIALELEAARRRRPDLDHFFGDDRLDGFFVKNLENVQGDERDIIIFSVGYGRDEHGKLTMNFGPLNRDGGFRRLNVAITRARRRLELISSITASDLLEPTNYGVQCLKAYLDYAARGVVALTPAADRASSGEPESPFEEDVLSVIRHWGYDAVAQVGHLGYRLDIAVRHPDRPGEWTIGIECDGAAYHSSLVARDRDRLRQDVLENLGWQLHRIWGTAWYRSRAQEEKRLRSAIESAIKGDRATGDRPRDKTKLVVDVESFDLSTAPDWTVPYRPYAATPRWSGPDLALPAAQSELQRDLSVIVEAEGPITKELLLVRLREIWASQNFTAARMKGIEQALATLVRSAKLGTSSPGVYALPGQAVGEVRRADEVRREKASHVPLDEVRMAMVLLVRDAHRIADDELTSRTAAIFGWARRGSDVMALLTKALNSLVDQGTLTRGAGGHLVPGTDRH